ncbi:hypothetical protein ISS03_04235 [Patescibacteria group bacterium]|nr:hypothetical protein [Patescibacteria group bacterium]
MINIVTGKPGTGKTYNLVRLAYGFIEEGKDVYSNFYINFDKYEQKRQKTYAYRIRNFLRIFVIRYLGIKLRPKRLGKIYFWKRIDEFVDIKGGEILIDECQIYFNSRGWKDLPPELQYKFQQHRKHIKRDENGKIIGLNIWGAVQNVRRIDTVIRELVNNVFILKKVGVVFLAKQYDIEEVDKENKICYSRVFFMFDKTLANSYDTFQEITGFENDHKKRRT